MSFDSADSTTPPPKDKTASLGANDKPYLIDASTFWRPAEPSKGTGDKTTVAKTTEEKTTGTATGTTTEVAGTTGQTGDRGSGNVVPLKAKTAAERQGPSPFRDPSAPLFVPPPEYTNGARQAMYAGRPDARTGGRDMTYSAMRRQLPGGMNIPAAYMANYGDNQGMPGPTADMPGGMPTPTSRFGQRDLAQAAGGRLFQGRDDQQPKDRRAGPIRRLFGRAGDGRPQDAPKAPAQVTMAKLEFNDKNETGVIKEMGLPDTFKKQPDTVPPDGRREYRPAPNSRS